MLILQQIKELLMFTCFYAGIILSEINVSTGKFETNADLRKVAQKMETILTKMWTFLIKTMGQLLLNLVRGYSCSFLMSELL